MEREKRRVFNIVGRDCAGREPAGLGRAVPTRFLLSPCSQRAAGLGYRRREGGRFPEQLRSFRVQPPNSSRTTDRVHYTVSPPPIRSVRRGIGRTRTPDTTKERVDRGEQVHCPSFRTYCLSRLEQFPSGR